MGLVYDFTDKAADASITRAASHFWLRKQAIQMLVSVFSIFPFLMTPALLAFLNESLKRDVFYIGNMKALPEAFIGSAEMKIN